jgi:predicted AlkP superfamily phosphohydrolase/phosphomutase
MAEDHNGLNNGRLDEEAYLQHCELVLKEREQLMRFELGRFKEGFFFFLFDTPDRLQHMMWRFRDRGHPLHNRDADRDFTTRIEQHYQRCDALLGSVLDHVDENTLLIVLSDHGFNTFRRAFDTNTWLFQNGLLALKDGKKPGQDLGEAFAAVDWSKTSAYALGLGGIYLNLKGREKAGVVDQGSEAERVRTAIQSGLAAHPDAETGLPAIRSVSRREELYSGPYADQAPDLLVNFHPGFRVAWKTAVGGFADHLIEDNTRKWSGDHIIDPEAVPGMLFINRTVVRENPCIIDLAPTVLEYLGVAVPNAVEGKSLF